MKSFRKVLCGILCGVLLFSVTSVAYADSLTHGGTRNISGTKKITWNELPEVYKEIIDQNAVIYKNIDGTYDIYQEKSVSQELRAIERYAPNGGTYSNFSNSSYGGTNLICLVYQTYMPSDIVGKYLVQNQPSVLEAAIQWVAAYGITTALTKLANVYGIYVNSNVLNMAISTAIVYFSSYNYNQMLNASAGGQHGVQIDYITTIGAGNSRIYSKWGSEPYVLTMPNGGTASWNAGEYYAEP